MVSLYLWCSNNYHHSHDQCFNTCKSFSRQLWMYIHRTNYNSNLAYIINSHIPDIKHGQSIKWHDHMCRL